MAVDIAPAIAGITYLRDFTKWVRGMQKDADVLTRTNAADERAGEVYDKLQELRSAPQLAKRPGDRLGSGRAQSRWLPHIG